MNNSFAVLRKFVREKAPVEVCEMCSHRLGAEHQHLIEPLSRKLICACDACAMLFSSGGETKYKRVPRRIRYLPNFRLTDAQWDALMIPINMAFFFKSELSGKVVALYPSPAGPTESLLALESWDDIVQANPVLKEMGTDVEALLVNRVGRARGFSNDEYYIVPIDECYKLVGLIRAHWRGLSGGPEVWEEIAAFFEGLRQRSVSIREGSRA
jgi:hypothetical protein